jgi:flagellar hook-associated protein 2
VVEDVRLELLGTSTEPVEVTVTQNVDSMVAALKAFAKAFNDAADRLSAHQSYDADTVTRGLLLGDSTALRVESRLYQLVREHYGDSSNTISRLTDIGFSVENEGQLTFDEEEFRETYARDPEAVEAMFDTPDTGLGDRLEEILEGLTDDIDGLLPRADKSLESQQEFLNTRIEQMQVLLDSKEERLRARFVAMESALAALQSQQSALSALTSLT